MAPAERADVIVDFTKRARRHDHHAAQHRTDSPFGGGVSGVDYPPADPQTTGAVMQFRVRSSRNVDAARRRIARQPGRGRHGAAASSTKLRRVSLNELDSATVNVAANPDGTFQIPIREACGDPNAVPFGPSVGLLGTVNADGTRQSRWRGWIRFRKSGAGSEIWEIRNFTADAHPIHIHQTQFRVLDRAPFDPENPSLPPGRRVRRSLGDGRQGHRRRLSRRDHPPGREVRSEGPVRVALPHPRSRGSRHDASDGHRQAAGSRA
jgi:bilirubin oxidase